VPVQVDDEPPGGAELVEGGRADEACHAATVRPAESARLGLSTEPSSSVRATHSLHMRRRGEIGAEQGEAGEAGFAELGQHVATVLASVRETAEKEAAAVLERARVQAAEIEADTAEKRTAAFAAAEDVRTRADAYAEKKRQEADEAAAEVLARAEWQARDRAQAAEERQQELDANVERAEERLRKLVDGLRELADRLDALVAPDALDEALQRQVEAEAAQEA
jgi:hypothetical protein